jgi:DNA-binding IclR family transcriptional regulator
MTSPGARRSTAGKIIALLESLAQHEQGTGVRELARESGIDKSAVSRLFDQLTELGFAQQDPVSGQFRAGPALFSLAAAVHARDTLWQAAEPVLRDLATAFNETCYLAVRDGASIIFREKVDCTHRVRYVIDPWERAPLHAGAGGRAVLLGLPEEETAGLLDPAGLTAITAKTITDPSALIRQIRQDRPRGYALSMGERVPEGCAVAAPFYAGDARCRGSLVFTSPAERFDIGQAPQIAAAVVRASAELSRRLGYRPG